MGLSRLCVLWALSVAFIMGPAEACGWASLGSVAISCRQRTSCPRADQKRDSSLRLLIGRLLVSQSIPGSLRVQTEDKLIASDWVRGARHDSLGHKTR